MDLLWAEPSSEYLNNPAALAAAHDVIVYCPLREGYDDADMNPGEPSTLIDFVTEEGGGLYQVSEYFGAGLQQQSIDDINMIGNPMGVNFLTTNLDWGQAAGEVEIDCFPDPQ